MPILLLILTVYGNHSAQTTTVPLESMSACQQLAAAIRTEFASAFAGDDPVYVVAKCVQAKRERTR
jgi:hypothetical protein